MSNQKLNGLIHESSFSIAAEIFHRFYPLPNIFLAAAADSGPNPSLPEIPERHRVNDSMRNRFAVQHLPAPTFTPSPFPRNSKSAPHAPLPASAKPLNPRHPVTPTLFYCRLAPDAICWFNLPPISYFDAVGVSAFDINKRVVTV
jgi:hypothetical protein